MNTQAKHSHVILKIMAVLVLGLISATARGDDNQQWSDGALPAQDPPPEMLDDRWVYSSVYTHSASDGQDWNTLDTELYFIPSNDWVLSASASYRDRGKHSDIIYGLHASHQVNPKWELHGSILYTPNANFSYKNGYVLGTQYQAHPRMTWLLEGRLFKFKEGKLVEIRPGVKFHISDQTSLTILHTKGRAFSERDYSAWAARLDHDFDQKRVSFYYSKGVDPEKDPSIPGVFFTQTETFGMSYRFPVRQNIDAILGVEHEKRDNSKSRVGIMAGVVIKF